MIILGLSGGHDANWCIIKDGKILGAFEKERFTKKRHDSGEIVSFIPATLKYFGLSIHDIDLIATSEPVHKGTESGIIRLAGNTYSVPDKWETHTVELLNKVLPCISVPHHLSHASYARYTSNFQNASVLTLDGGGDFYTIDAYSSSTISCWKDHKLEWLKRIDNSDFGSLWFTYAKAIFGDGNHAGKLMGLAALGASTLVKSFKERFCTPVRGILEGATTIKNCWPDHFSPPFIKAGANWEDKTSQDIAYAVQFLTEEAGLSLVEKFSEISSYKNLAISGGVALNGYLNTKITKSGFFDKVFVPPSVHDGGISIGASLFAFYHVLDNPYRPHQNNELAFLGCTYNDHQIHEEIVKSGVTFTPIEKNKAIELVSTELLNKKTIAWYEGGSEHGPRALGHRSILSLPHYPESKNTLNDQIKFRESFRPIAPVVLEEEAHKFFEMDWFSPYMMYIVDSKKGMETIIPSGLHIDGTARVQTVSQTSSLGKIISNIAHETNIGCILNTSFNIRTPITETPRDAIEAFTQVPIDYLYLDGYLLQKK